MPGYEPFLLCDFHVHTRWSDGRLTIGEVVDLYGSTGKFDVIAITDHILMKKDILARAGRLATFGRRAYGVREDNFDAYLADIRKEADRARDQYGMSRHRRAEIHPEPDPRQQNSHIIGSTIKNTSARSQTAMRSIANPRQGALSIDCIPITDGRRRVEISPANLWDHRRELSGL